MRKKHLDMTYVTMSYMYICRSNLFPKRKRNNDADISVVVTAQGSEGVKEQNAGKF